jgi:hypothetical protein
VDVEGVHATNFLTNETDFNELVDRIDDLESITIPAINEEL